MINVDIIGLPTTEALREQIDFNMKLSKVRIGKRTACDDHDWKSNLAGDDPIEIPQSAALRVGAIYSPTSVV